MIAADTMRSLPDHFADIDDPRRRQGRRHPLPVVLAIAAGATLCGARGYKAMAEWADDLSPRARERFMAVVHASVLANPVAARPRAVPPYRRLGAKPPSCGNAGQVAIASWDVKRLLAICRPVPDNG